MNAKQEELLQKREKLMGMGGEAAVAKQHSRGKLTCRERLDLLFDPGTFEEIGLFAEKRKTNYGLDKKQVPADGVVCGYGKVDGRTVFAYAQDFTSMGGSIGEITGIKMLRVMRAAIRSGCPLVCLNDGSGGRLQEGTVTEFNAIFQEHVNASGWIPQIAAIMGPCAGGSAYSPALTDFLVCVDNTSKMFLTGPKVIKTVTGEEPGPDFGSGAFHNEVSGVSHALAADDPHCIDIIRCYLSYFPQNSKEKPPVYECDEDPLALIPELNDIIPENPRQGYDVHQILELIADEGSLFEYQPMWAQNYITTLGRLNGKSIGFIASNPRVAAGCYDIDASDKVARFVSLCDAFGIPLVFVADVPGFLPGIDQESGGIIRHGAKTLHAIASATVPKVRLTTRKLYGGATSAMCEQGLGPDATISWPSAEEAATGAAGACEVLYAKELKQIRETEGEAAAQAQLKVWTDEYEKLYNNPYDKAKYLTTEMVIMPDETRRVLIHVMEAFENKTVAPIYKRHTICPV